MLQECKFNWCLTAVWITRKLVDSRLHQQNISILRWFKNISRDLTKMGGTIVWFTTDVSTAVKVQSSFPWKKWEVGFRCAIRSYIPREGGGGAHFTYSSNTTPHPQGIYTIQRGSFKTFADFEILWVFAKFFSGYGVLWWHQQAIHKSFFPIFRQFTKVFSRESFPLYGNLLPRQPHCWREVWATFSYVF